MTKNANAGDLGSLGFKLLRVKSNSSYDPCAGIEWRPPRESDELFEALKMAFPERKTHRERMCEALVQFLAEELKGASDNAAEETPRSVEVAPNADAHGQSADQSYRKSKKPLFWTQTPSGEQSPFSAAPMTKANTVNASQVLNKDAKQESSKKSKDWEDFTVVWKSNVGLTKGARPRRMMTEEERTDYRMRRVRGACVSCKRKKRKCNHDPEPSPSSSSETMQSLSETSVQKEHGNGELAPHERSRIPSGRFVDELVLCVSQEDGMGSSKSSSISQVTADMIHGEQPGDVPVAQSTSLYQYTSMPGDSSQHCWDLSANELQMLDKYLDPQALDLENLPLDLTFPATASQESIAAYNWDAGTYEFGWSVPLCADHRARSNLLSPTIRKPATPEHRNFQPCAINSADVNFQELAAGQYILPPCPAVSPDELRAQQCQPSQKAMTVPTLEELENHWAHSQGQQHIEQWLEHKTVEEHSEALNRELSPSEDEEPASASPTKKRRVKFDFSTLIDGPPTLSIPPAVGSPDGGIATIAKQQQPVSRPPRSTSRHSTGSRMSFSDIHSLSSALTSLSMKDAESRRGSVYSGSERNMEDGNEDDDEEEDSNDLKQDDSAEKESAEQKSDGDEDDDSDEWLQWLDDERERTPPSRGDLFENYIRIKMQKSN